MAKSTSGTSLNSPSAPNLPHRGDPISRTQGPSSRRSSSHSRQPCSNWHPEDTSSGRDYSDAGSLHQGYSDTGSVQGYSDAGSVRDFLETSSVQGCPTTLTPGTPGRQGQSEITEKRFLGTYPRGSRGRHRRPVGDQLCTGAPTCHGTQAPGIEQAQSTPMQRERGGGGCSAAPRSRDVSPAKGPRGGGCRREGYTEGRPRLLQGPALPGTPAPQRPRGTGAQQGGAPATCQVRAGSATTRPSASGGCWG